MAPRGGGAKSGGALPNLRSFGPKTAIFRPKRPPNPPEAPKRRETAATLHVRLDFTVSKSPILPFNSTICPRNGPKRRQKVPKTAPCAPAPRNQARAVSWATWLKNEFRGHLVHPQPPHFLWFPSLRIAQRATQTPVPVVTWLSQRASQPAHGGGQRWVHQGPRGEKNHFFQSCSQTTWDAQTSVFRPF